MRKTLLVLLTLTTLVGFSGCEKKEVYLPSKSFTQTINPADWTTDDGKVWYADINVPELDGYYFDQGTVAVDMSFVDDVFESIPSTYEGLTYNFDYSVGLVRVYYRRAGSTEQALERPAEVIYAKVILSEADPI